MTIILTARRFECRVWYGYHVDTRFRSERAAGWRVARGVSTEGGEKGHITTSEVLSRHGHICSDELLKKFVEQTEKFWYGRARCNGIHCGRDPGKRKTDGRGERRSRWGKGGRESGERVIGEKFLLKARICCQWCGRYTIKISVYVSGNHVRVHIIYKC